MIYQSARPPDQVRAENPLTLAGLRDFEISDFTSDLGILKIFRYLSGIHRGFRIKSKDFPRHDGGMWFFLAPPKSAIIRINSMGLPLVDQQEHRFSYQDYCQRDDEKRWEIIDVIEYDMAAAPFRIHQHVSMELSVRFYDFFKRKNCKVYSAPFDVRLSEIKDAADEDIFTVVQPDITVVCDPAKLDERGCKGPPDLIVEILSPSSAGTDMKIKRNLYERYGVKEYWIVHPNDKIAMLYSIGENGQYEKAEIYTQEDMVESKLFPELKIRLSEIFSYA